MAKEKKVESTNKEDASKNLLNSLLKGYSDTHYNFIETKPVLIDSGSLLLNSHVKIYSNSALKLSGPPETGKSSQAMLFAANFMKKMPKSKTIYVNAEAKFGEEIKARTGLKYVEKPDEWNVGTVFIFQTNILETICDTLMALLNQAYESGEHLCIIIDSIDALTLKSSVDESIATGRRPAGVNYYCKELFRKIGHKLSKYNSMIILLGQYSATFSLEAYSKEPPKTGSGNSTNGVNHFSSVVIDYQQRYGGDYILEKEKEKPDPEKNKILGVYCRAKLSKCSTNATNYTVMIPIKFNSTSSDGSNIWRSKEIGDMICMWQLAVKGGAWLSFDPSIVGELKAANLDLKEKVNGINALYEYLEENPLIMDYFYQKFSKMLSQA